MFNDLENWANFIVDNYEDTSAYIPMCDWMTEQGFHNFDVGKDVHLVLFELHKGYPFFILKDRFDNGDYSYWKEQIIGKIIKELPIKTMKFISQGREEICFRYWKEPHFWYKNFAFSSKEKATEFNSFVLKRFRSKAYA